MPSRQIAGGHPKIVQAVGLFRSRHAVVEGLPLIGQDPLRDQAQHGAVQLVRDTHLVQRNGGSILFHGVHSVLFPLLGEILVSIT